MFSSLKMKMAMGVVIRNLLVPLALARLWAIEIIEISSLVSSRTHLKKLSTKRANVFNLDLHISVIQDYEKDLTEQRCRLVRFSISSHNHLVKGLFPTSDPVAVVNSRTWKNLDQRLIEKFRSRYKLLLSSFDGFIVTYSPTFFELFAKEGKPILAVAATRYEAPYTDDTKKWIEFDQKLKQYVSTGSLTLVANNRGDADYIRYFTGIDVKVLPSYCGGKGLWTGESGRRVTIARDPALKGYVGNATGGLFQPIESLGSPYKWKDLISCLEVFVVPQNISTMTLFELATAGVPVVVPTREFFSKLRETYFGVLDELTFTELLGIRGGHASDSPDNWEWEGYLDWWLDRSDFYDSNLMPNVRLANSIEDLLLSDKDVMDRRLSIESDLRMRNSRIARERQEFVSNWINTLSSGAKRERL
jgi:hypothetical protein